MTNTDQLMALADELRECRTYTDGEIMPDHAEPLGADCGLLRRAEEAIRALARPEDGEAKECAHNETRARWDHIYCVACGAVKTGPHPEWGIAKNMWFRSADEARFYQQNGRHPTPPAPAGEDARDAATVAFALCRHAAEVSSPENWPEYKIHSRTMRLWAKKRDKFMAQAGAAIAALSATGTVT
jgi:hypothetical protein